MSKLILYLIFLLNAIIIFSLDLNITEDDVYIEKEGSDFHVYIRKKPDINSVIIAETQDRERSKYTLRSLKFNPINGNEKRILDKKMINNTSILSLIDSRAEPDKVFGEAFHIFLPSKVLYGYPEEEHGEYNVGELLSSNKDFYVSFLAFQKPYGDYSGENKGNILNLTKIYMNSINLKNGKKPSKSSNGSVEEKRQALNDLIIKEDDIYVEPREDGYHIFIRKKPGMNSVLITETNETDDKKPDTYAYRAFAVNDINGHEKRILDGKFLDNERLLSLVDSTPEPNAKFGEAFHILLPDKVLYGYPETGQRYGEINLRDILTDKEKGFWLSFRTFTKPYADYEGLYYENPFELFLDQQKDPQPSTVDTRNKEIYEQYGVVANTKTSNLVDDIKGAIDKADGKTLDLVFALDTTKSMDEDLEKMRETLLNIIENTLGKFESWRIGFVLYKDYQEIYVTKVIQFSSDMSSIQKVLESITVGGGGDYPEAVNEALYAGLTELNWENESRLMILVGDAPPHDIPRGKVSRDDVLRESKRKQVKINIMLLSQDRGKEKSKQ